MRDQFALALLGQQVHHDPGLLGTNGQSIAIPVDELVGQQLILLRPLRGVMARLPNLTGTALLAGGEVGMVLSASSLLSSSEGMGLGMMGAAA